MTIRRPQVVSLEGLHAPEIELLLKICWSGWFEDISGFEPEGISRSKPPNHTTNWGEGVLPWILAGPLSGAQAGAATANLGRARDRGSYWDGV